LSESNACRCIGRAEELLIRSGSFSLPGRKVLQASDASFEFVIVDATETEIERQKKQRAYYSSKKKQHHLKTQVVIDQKDGKILCTAFAKGRQHDFALFKKSKIRLAPQVILLADSGYQGAQKFHPNSIKPLKASKLTPLTKADKKDNADISRVRIKVENALAFIKRFKIFSTRYRNRARRFGLRFSTLRGHLQH
jgi:IS5 family transposase